MKNKHNQQLIICPCCGNEIIFDKTEYKNPLPFEYDLNHSKHPPKFDYRICYKCNGKFTKIPIKPYLRYICVAAICCFFMFTSIICGGNQFFLKHLALAVGIDICLFISMIVSIVIYSKENNHLKNPQNGYLPILNGDDMDREVNCLDERSFFKSDIEKRMVYKYLNKAIILLPSYSNVMKIYMNDKFEIKALKKFDTYKINAENCIIYLTLCNYSVENNDILLYFKVMNNGAEQLSHENKYTLYSMSENQVCTVQLVQ